MTTGAPMIAVTVLILSSVGAKTVLAIRSQTRHTKAPRIKQTGITKSGFVFFNSFVERNGTATPTKEIGPANAAAVALKTPLTMMIRNLSLFTFTPIVNAYDSESIMASIGFERQSTSTKQTMTMIKLTLTLDISAPEKLPLVQLCRFTTSLSEKNVTIISQTALQM